MLDAARYERAIKVVSEARGKAAKAASGDYQRQINKRRTGAKFYCSISGRRGAGAAESVVHVSEVVDLGPWRARAAAKSDRRLGQLGRFAAPHGRNWDVVGGLGHLTRRYARNVQIIGS